MSARRIAAVAAVAVGGLWLLKALVICNAGGLDESSLESPLFVAGLLALVPAAAAFGAAVMEDGRSPRGRLRPSRESLPGPRSRSSSRTRS